MGPSHQDAICIVRSEDPNNRQFGTSLAVHQDEDSTYFLTCMHVVTAVGGPDHVMVGRYPAHLVAWGSEDLIDLAVLRVSQRLDIPTLSLSIAGHTGDRFSATGFREFGNNYLLDSIQGTLGQQSTLVSGRQGESLKTWYLEIDAGDALRKGHSGSPVISLATGRVIAVISHREGVNRGLAIPARALREIWPELPPGTIRVSREPLKAPDRRPETLSERIGQEGYWGFLEQAAIQAVAGGGIAAMTYYRQTETLSTLPWPAVLDHVEKERNPSTVADLQATAAILQIIDVHLSPIHRRLGCALKYLGEETEFREWLKDNVRRQASERIKEPDKFFTGESNIIRVVLDAIDGTVNFIHGIPLFCSGLAILVDGVPRVSAVYDPIHHVVYSGVLRGPDSNPEALAEARILQVAAGNQIDLVQLASDTETQKACEEILGVHLTRSKRDKLHEFLGARSLSEESQLERLAHTFRGIYAFNSGIVAMTDVARGALGGFVNNTTNLWDVAPGEVLVRACGGKVTDIFGATIDYSRYSADRRTSVVAGRTSSLHSKILNIVGA